MVQGNAYRGTVGQPLPGSIVTNDPFALAAISVSGANLTGRWAHRLEGGSEVMLQAYYDRTERTIPPVFAEKLDIVDVELQQSLQWTAAYSLVWGGEFRYGRDRVANSPVFAFLPADLNQKWSSLFAQGEAKLRDDLELTLGARLERNDYTGTEFLPGARLGWKIAADHLLWSAISRTVRAPSRLDRDAFVPGKPPFLLDGGPAFRSEVAKVYEVGYRGQPFAKISYSVTAFYADYDHLHTTEVSTSRTYFVFANGMEARTSGVEMWGAWQAASWWRLSAGFTGQRERLRLKPGSNDAGSLGTAGRDPAHTWLVRSSMNLPARTEVDVTVRGVAALANPNVPSYSTVDLRLGWRPRPDLELSLSGRNLADGGHGEFTTVAFRAEIGRSIYASVRWDFAAR
jgi:iron complex outermembrane receptor protein